MHTQQETLVETPPASPPLNLRGHRFAPLTYEAMSADQPPPELAADEALVYAFASELLAQRRVSDATYTALVARFAERGAVDLMGTMSYYALVSMALNVDQYPLPDGALPVFTEVCVSLV